MKNIALKAIFAGLITVFALQITTTSITAKEICYTQYGGGEECVDESAKLEVEKVIYNPKSGNWESNIDPTSGSNPYLFDPEEEISFRIKVKNTGDIRLENIELEDILPSYVTYDDGDGDENDSGSKVEFDEFDLDPGESRTFKFDAEIAEDGVLPKDDYVCLTNIAKAEGEHEDDSDETEESVDYANFCIDLPGESKEVITVLPKTGFENPFLVGSLSLGFLLIGLGLKEVTKS